jgi:hypothetical protein
MFDNGVYTVHLAPIPEQESGTGGLWELSVIKTRNKKKYTIIAKKNITYDQAQKIIKKLKKHVLLDTQIDTI